MRSIRSLNTKTPGRQGPGAWNSSGNASYQQKVKNLFGLSMIGYWPLDELSGAVAYDQSGNGRNGTYSGLTLGEPGMGDGKTSVRFDGTNNDVINLFSASLASEFNGQEGTFSIWVKGYTSAFWSDGAYHRIARFEADTNNTIQLTKHAGNYDYLYYKAGATVKDASTSVVQPVDGWVHVAITWSLSAGVIKIYTNGVQTRAGTTAIGTWSGALVSAVLGYFGGYRYNGWMAHAALGNTALSASQIAQLADKSWPGWLGVVIMFDDGYTDNYTRAYPVMQPLGIKGTIYQITNSIGSDGYLTAEQLQDLYANGWDIANHTHTHPVLTGLTQAQQETEFTTARGVLDGLGLTRASQHVAYPQGGNNADTLAALAATGMLTGRPTTIVNSIEPKTIYRYHLPLIAYISASTGATVETVQAKINEARATGGVATLLFHSIVQSGAVNQQWNLADFTTIMEWLAAQGIPSLTMSEFYALMI